MHAGIFLGGALALAGCLWPLDRCERAAAGERLDCPMPGMLDRSFAIAVPPGWDGSTPLPTVLLIHGGGGNRRSAERITCPSGDESDPGCFVAAANRRGYAVVRPDGTGSRPTRNVRSWNAGGGTGGWQCVSGPACRSGVDDIAYFRALLDEVGRIVPVDDRRIYASGLSNGGAMTHRLACALGLRFAAVAPFSGGNQFAASGGDCPTPVPVLQIHGTEDPCWAFTGGPDSCIDGGGGGVKQTVDATLEGWRVRNGCASMFTDAAVPDRDPADGTTAVHRRWVGCQAALEIIRVDGGGHTWPGGWQYFGTGRIGRLSHDFSATNEVLAFFDAHAR